MRPNAFIFKPDLLFAFQHPEYFFHRIQPQVSAYWYQWVGGCKKGCQLLVVGCWLSPILCSGCEGLLVVEKVVSFHSDALPERMDVLFSYL